MKTIILYVIATSFIMTAFNQRIEQGVADPFIVIMSIVSMLLILRDSIHFYVHWKDRRFLNRGKK
jgi:nicotinamide riboside transporter PnuC